MKTERSKKENEAGGAGRPDPFAVDIFGRKAELVDIAGISLESVRSNPLPDGVTTDWANGFEEISYGADALQTQTPAYPHWFEKVMNRAVLPRLASLTGDDQVRATFEVLSFEDVSFADPGAAAAEGSGVRFGFENGGLEGMFFVSAEFASGLIDRLLDGTVSGSVPRRSLTGIELSICEYLSTELLSAFNQSLDENSALRIKLAADPDHVAERTGRAVEIVGDFVFGDLSGMLTILAPHGLLEVLNRNFESPEMSQKALLAERFGDVISETNLFLDIGSTSISAVEIPFLETGDVVLVTDPVHKWWDGDLNCGAVRCFPGSSSNLAIEGKLGADSGAVELRINGAVEARSLRNYDRIRKKDAGQGANGVKEVKEKDSAETGGETAAQDQAAEIPNEGDPADSLVALENVMVDLRVLVAGRKISLSELGSLRAGQIIGLGCRPEDPVELVAENSDRPIATGELVKIDEQLGVRITKVLV